MRGCGCVSVSTAVSIAVCRVALVRVLPRDNAAQDFPPLCPGQVQQ